MIYTLWLISRFEFGIMWLVLEASLCFVVLVPFVHVFKARQGVVLLFYLLSIDCSTLCRNTRYYRYLQARIVGLIFPSEMIDSDIQTQALSMK